VTVPTNSTLTIHNQTVLIHPIIDEFYNPSPSFKRSSKFAENKGQITTEMAKATVKDLVSGTSADALPSSEGQLQAVTA